MAPILAPDLPITFDIFEPCVDMATQTTIDESDIGVQAWDGLTSAPIQMASTGLAGEPCNPPARMKQSVQMVSTGPAGVPCNLPADMRQLIQMTSTGPAGELCNLPADTRQPIQMASTGPAGELCNLPADMRQMHHAPAVSLGHVQSAHLQPPLFPKSKTSNDFMAQSRSLSDACSFPAEVPNAWHDVFSMRQPVLEEVPHPIVFQLAALQRRLVEIHIDKSTDSYFNEHPFYN